LAISLFPALGLGAATPEREPERAPGCGRLEMRRCQIEIVLGDDGRTIEAQVGQQICPGDAAESGANSRARWLMTNGDSFEILPDTRLFLTKGASAGAGAKWRLDRGGAIVTRPQRPNGGPALEPLAIEYPGGEARLYGPRALLTLLPDGRARAVSFKGVMQISASGAAVASLAPSEELAGSARKKLTAPQLREIEKSLHDWPARKKASTESGCGPF
jgi:hypothetical protein